MCTELLDVCKAVSASLSKQGADSASAPVAHCSTTSAFPFVAGLEVKGVGNVSLPFQSGAAALLVLLRAAQEQAALQSSGTREAFAGPCGAYAWPAAAFAFANPAWHAHIEKLVTDVKAGLHLPKVRAARRLQCMDTATHLCIAITGLWRMLCACLPTHRQPDCEKLLCTLCVLCCGAALARGACSLVRQYAGPASDSASARACAAAARS